MKKLLILFIAVAIMGIFAAADVLLHKNTEAAVRWDEAANMGTEAVGPDAAGTGSDGPDGAAAAGDPATGTGEAANTNSGVGAIEAADAEATPDAGGTATAGWKTGEDAAANIDPNVLIQNLDKQTDETVYYIYGESPENITVGSMVEGSFTGSGKPELLVIFKLLNVPHAGGLDCSVAAVYDRRTFGLIAQKTFAYDECRFTVLEDDEKMNYLLFVGSTTYQGYSQYSFGLWKPGKVWEEILENHDDQPYSRKYQLREDGSIEVSRLNYVDPESLENTWLHEYNLVWNSKTRTLDEIVPTEYKDEKGNPNIDAVSVSPDGRYAISTVLDRYRVLLYDTQTNKLTGDFKLLAQDYGFLWSQDSSKVCVIRTARVWVETSIIEIASKKVIELPPVYSTFQKMGIKMDYVLQEYRPDPYVTPIEWSPDGKKVLFFYQWTDSDYVRQSGTFVYDSVSGGISRITQNASEAEGGNLSSKKPEGFKW